MDGRQTEKVTEKERSTFMVTVDEKLVKIIFAIARHAITQPPEIPILLKKTYGRFQRALLRK